MKSNLDIDRVMNATAYDHTGDKIGSVGQLYLHDETGEPAWVSINTGFFGTSQSFAPMEGARFDEDDHLVLAVDKDIVKDAPRIDDDGHLNEAEYRTLYDYYAGHLGAGRTGADRDLGDRDLGDRDRKLSDRDRDDRVVTDAERRNVDNEREQAGQVRLRKHVVTRHETVTVPVHHEEVEVVREPAGAGRDVGETRMDGVVDEPRGAKDKDRNVLSKEDMDHDGKLETKVDLNKDGRDDLGRDKR